jgi:hypothetical protein
MDIMDPDNSQYIQLAIKTVFYLNRDRIHNDASSNESFIQDMTSEIMTRAQKFKLLTTSMEELH